MRNKKVVVVSLMIGLVQMPAAHAQVAQLIMGAARVLPMLLKATRQNQNRNGQNNWDSSRQGSSQPVKQDSQSDASESRSTSGEVNDELGAGNGLKAEAAVLNPGTIDGYLAQSVQGRLIVGRSVPVVLQQSGRSSSPAQVHQKIGGSTPILMMPISD